MKGLVKMTKFIEQMKMKKLAKKIAGVTLGAIALGAMSVSPVYAAEGALNGGTYDSDEKEYTGTGAVTISGASTGTTLEDNMKIYGIKDPAGSSVTGSVTAANFDSSSVKGLQIWGGYSEADVVKGINNKVLWDSSAKVKNITTITGFYANANEVSATGTTVTLYGATVANDGTVYGAYVTATGTATATGTNLTLDKTKIYYSPKEYCGAYVESSSGDATATGTTLTLTDTTKEDGHLYGAKVKGKTSAKATGTTVNMTGGSVSGDFYGVEVGVDDKDTGVAEATGTTLIINGATLNNIRGAKVEGKKTGKANDTKVTITGGELKETLNAAEVQSNEDGSIGEANNTTLIIDGTEIHTAAAHIQGALVSSNAGGEILSATGTTVKLNLHADSNMGNLTGAHVSGDTGHDKQAASTTADTTWVEMNGGTVQNVDGAKFYHTKSAEAKVTTVTLNNVTAESVTGVNVTESEEKDTPIAEDAKANDTTVTVTGTTVTGAIIGVNVAAVTPGNTEAKTVTANNTKLTINGAKVTGDVAGVRAKAEATGTITAKNTQVIFEGAASTVTGIVYGVDLSGTASITPSGTALTVKNAGNKVGNIAGFDTINFVLPSQDGALLTITGSDPTNFNSSNTELSKAIDATRANLNGKDKVNLIETSNGLTLKPGTEDEKITLVANAVSTKMGKYELVDSGKNLVLSITGDGEKTQEILDNEKSFTETLAASVALLNSGADFATEQALGEAKAAAREGVKEGAREMMPFAAFGGSSMKYKSGSHIDAKGWNAAVGFAKEQGELTYGIAVEHGQADFDSYVNAAHGEGKNKYTGGVIFAELKKENGAHFDASFRAGRAENDYSANLSVMGISTPTSYDISATYLGFSLGGGREMKVSETGKLDLYGRYYFNHLNGTNAKTNSGIDVEFKDSDSSRLRLGTRYTQQLNERNKLYAGLAWQYEFAGKARSVVNGVDAPSPSLKGHSALLELGIKTKAGKNLDIDFGLNGWVGKQRGIAGNLGFKWTF
ncbi:MAG: autotransporter outer membrane beta-barrel domain-containing protein [Selenomonadaceae bacterium]|nr:autotransporter outer membrane beta-barrel domain-containing protein [Selenomonadaceae bacterium]